MAKEIKRSKRKFTDSEIVSAILMHREESKNSKTDRTQKNEENWNAYHMQGDFSDKREGQSAHFLPKLFVAAERAVSVIKKALINLDQWIEVVGIRDDLIFTPEAIKAVLLNQLEKCDIKTKITDAVKNALLESLATACVHGENVKQLVFEAVEAEVTPDFLEETIESGMAPRKQLKRSMKDVWQLRVDIVGSANFFPDPTGQDLFGIKTVEKDLFQIKQLSEGKDAIYKKDLVDQLAGSSGDPEEEQLEDAKQGLEDQEAPSRKLVKLTEFAGTLIDSSGEVIHENCIATVAEDRLLIRPPEDNPFWHYESPYVSAPLLRVPDTVWHKAIMDAGSAINCSLNDMFNLMVDGGMNAAINATEIRMGWLQDPSQVSNGIRPGDSIKVKDTAPVGVPAVTPIRCGDVPNDSLQMYNLLDSEFQAGVFSNDTSLGQTPGKTTTATAVAEASASLTALFDSYVRDFEDTWLEPLLQKCHLTIWQNIEKTDQEELITILGKDRALAILSMDEAERFARVSNLARFRAKGISAVLNRFRDVARFQQIVQMIGSSPDLMAEFKKKHSFSRMLSEFIMAIGLDESKIALTQDEQAEAEQERQQQMQMQQQLMMAEAQAKGSRKPGPKPQADFESMNQEMNPEVVGQMAQAATQGLGGLR